MSKFVILLGGDLVVGTRLRRQLSGARAIAADSGMKHAQALEIIPELWVGDFDSANEEMQQQYQNVERMTFPAAKDMTDGELAINEALRRGAREIIFCGAFGGSRADHMMALMTKMAQLSHQGIAVFMTSGNQEGWPINPGQSCFDLPDSCLFSIIGFGYLDGLTIEGAQWTLNDHAVPFGASLTLSNHVRGTLCVRLRSGNGILIACPQG